MTQQQKTNLAVEAKGLIKVFGDNRAVDGVDLQVAEGCIYGVLGPNGAGKSTVINILSTLLKADGGTAKIFGYDVKKEPQIVRQLIGLTGQSASVDEALSATENLVIFSRLLGLHKQQAKQKAAELLEEFSLSEAAKRPLSKFSGGMRRRLDLAASLIAQPPLIFLDEPTTGLDPRTRNQMWDTIRRLVTSGSTVLLTSQLVINGITNKTATATTLNSNNWIRCTANSFTLTMGTTGFQAGQLQMVTNEGAGTITLAAATGTIDLITLPPASGATFMWDGTNWHTVGSWGTQANTSSSVAVSTTTPTTGSAFTPSSVADTEIFFVVTTSVSLTITYGPTTGAENTLVSAVTMPVGNTFTKRIPKGWKVVITGTIASISTVTIQTL